MNYRLLCQALLSFFLLTSFTLRPSGPGPWPKGLSVKPDASVDRAAFEKHYRADKALWDKAFEFLNRKDLATLPPGKYPIAGEEVFATITDKPSKEFSVSEWESHRKYLDIHYVITGKQKLGIATLGEVTVREAYDPKRDVVFYNDIGKGKYYIAGPSTFFICYPENPHRPDIKVPGYDRSKKLVIKIRTK
jgi:YhcH/YjgK/YiaL family protein